MEIYHTTGKISSANIDFGSANIQRYYTVQQLRGGREPRALPGPDRKGRLGCGPMSQTSTLDQDPQTSTLDQDPQTSTLDQSGLDQVVAQTSTSS